jgi:DNA-binding transcriptional LysR family regulator
VDIEITRLEYFVALVDQGSFGRAASKLFISQPALSQQIVKLEKEIGVTLIDRNVRPFAVTAAGRDLYVQSKTILEHVKKIEDIATQHKEGLSGNVRLGVTPALLYSHVPSLVKSFTNKYPGISVSVERENTLVLVDMLHHGLLDVAIMFARTDDKDLKSRKIFEDEFVAVLPIDHPAAVSESVDLKQLNRDNIIMMRRSGAPESHDTVIAACMQAGFAPNSIIVKGSYLDHVGYVSAGFGVGIIPKGVTHLKLPNVAYRPLRNPRITVSYFVCWAELKTHPSMRLFIEHCAANAARYLTAEVAS